MCLYGMPDCCHAPSLPPSVPLSIHDAAGSARAEGGMDSWGLLLARGKEKNNEKTTKTAPASRLEKEREKAESNAANTAPF